MSISNTFSGSRFIQLIRQQITQNSKLILFGMVGYSGVIFIVLMLFLVGNNGESFSNKAFFPSMLVFSASFGILYAGYSFPGLRTKEKSISYLTLPASAFEKFLWEFFSRVVLTMLLLPLMYWFMYNLTGHFFSLIFNIDFAAVGPSDLKQLSQKVTDKIWEKFTMLSIATLVLVLPFSGAAMFSKQPLIKSLFSIAVIVLSYIGMIYVVMKPLGLSEYTPDDDSLLFPAKEENAIKVVGCLLWLSSMVFLCVTFLKLKEKEV